VIFSTFFVCILNFLLLKFIIINFFVVEIYRKLKFCLTFCLIYPCLVWLCSICVSSIWFVKVKSLFNLLFHFVQFVCFYSIFKSRVELVFGSISKKISICETCEATCTIENS
jgi:hypothetical protein